MFIITSVFLFNSDNICIPFLLFPIFTFLIRCLLATLYQDTFLHLHIIYAFLSDCHGTRTHNYIDRKWTLNHLAKLTNWLSCAVSTYLYVALTVCLYHVTYVFRVTMCFCYQISLFYIIAWIIVTLSTVDKFFFRATYLSDTFSWSFSFYVFFTLSQIFRNYIDYKCPLFLSLDISFCPLFMYWYYFTALHWNFSFFSTVLNMLTRLFSNLLLSAILPSIQFCLQLSCFSSF